MADSTTPAASSRRAHAAARRERRRRRGRAAALAAEQRDAARVARREPGARAAGGAARRARSRASGGCAGVPRRAADARAVRRRASAARRSPRDLGRLTTRPGPAVAGAARDPLHRRRTQLWVRVFPDDCAVDTFEPSAVRGRGRNARATGTASGAPAGVEADERAAWRGAGRQPRLRPRGLDRRAATAAEPGDEPSKARPTDVLLVIAADGAVPAAERRRRRGLLDAVWLADGDAAAEARRAERCAGGASARTRAERSSRDQRPFNLDSPRRGDGRADVGSRSPSSCCPRRPRRPRRRRGRRRRARACCPTASCCSATRRRAGADQSAGRYRRRCSVGPDPSAPRTSRSQTTTASSSCPTSCTGWSTSTAPSRTAWASAIALDAGRPRGGFDRLLVARRAAGRRHATRAATSWRRCSRPPPQPRRARADPAGHADQQHRGRRRRASRAATMPTQLRRLLRAPVLATASRLARSGTASGWPSAGHRHGAARRRAGAGGTDQREPRDATPRCGRRRSGYFLETMLDPVFGDATVDADARWFFTGYVSGRGARAGDPRSAPALRHPADDRLLADQLARRRDRGREARRVPGTRFLRRCTRCCRRRGRLGAARAPGAARRRRRRPAPDAARHPRPAPGVGGVPLALRGEHRGLFNRLSSAASAGCSWRC